MKKMSITLDIKKEISQREIAEDCCNAAFLSALIKTAGSLVIEGNKRLSIELVSSKVKTDYIEELYGLTVQQADKIIKISGVRTEELLGDLGILTRGADGTKNLANGIDKHLIQGDCCKALYIRGAFLGAGSLSIIKKGGYHLQFANSSLEFCNNLVDMLTLVGISSKVIAHADQYLVYIKDSQSISDLLAIVGADKGVLKLNNNIVEREFGCLLNRQTNCILANIDKTVTASVMQCKAIQKLSDDGRLAQLSEDYITLANLRLAQPSMTYQELSENLRISKSSVKYKLDKLVQLGTRIMKT